jgi:hypothetical protein
LSFPLASKPSLPRRDSPTSPCVAKTARMPRRPVWRVVARAEARVPREEAVEEEVVLAMLTKEESATVAVSADSPTMVAEAVEVASVVVAEEEERVREAEVAVSAMLTREENATVAASAGFPTIKQNNMPMLYYSSNHLFP